MAGKQANGAGTIYKRKDGRYEGAAFVHASGGRRLRTRVYAKTRTEAQRRLNDVLERSRQGLPRPDVSQHLEGFLLNWLETVARPPHLRPLTAKSYESLIRLYLIPKLGKHKLTTLSVPEVQAAFDDLLRDGTSIRTVEKVRAVLRAALSTAMREELVFRNVAKLVQIPRSTRKPIEPWSIDEAKSFVAVAREHRWYPAFMLLLGYGVRKGEALGLRWSDVDFVNGVIHIRQQIQYIDGELVASDVKTDAGRRSLPLTSHARDVLGAEAARREVDISRSPETPVGASTDGLLTITSRGTPVDPGNFLKCFLALTKKAGVRRITIHQIRHTLATMLAATGAQERDAQLILGHAHVTTTQMIYQHGSTAQRGAALEQVGEVFEQPYRPGTDLPAADAGRDRCRQTLPSNRLIAIEPGESQDPRGPQPTGVDDLDSHGTPDWIRTSDQRLRRPLCGFFAYLPTPVLNAELARTRRLLTAHVAVKSAVRTDPSIVASATNLDELRATRAILRDARTEQLRRRSFPLSLIPTSMEDA